MPNTKIALLFDVNGTPVDAWSWDEQYSWGGPPSDHQSFKPGDRLVHYERRLTDAEIKELAKKAEDKLVQDRLEAARALLRANGELPDPNAPAPSADQQTGQPF